MDYVRSALCAVGVLSRLCGSEGLGSADATSLSEREELAWGLKGLEPRGRAWSPSAFRCVPWDHRALLHSLSSS